MRGVTKPSGTLPKFKKGNNSITAASMNTLVDFAKAGVGGAVEFPSKENRFRFPTFRRAKLIGYANNNTAFTARLISASGDTDAESDPITLQTIRWPFERDLTQCVPKLDRYFNSDDPRAWVPVKAGSWCDPEASEDDSECGAVLFVDINFHGAGCS